jgi:hypothetical protein
MERPETVGGEVEVKPRSGRQAGWGVIRERRRERGRAEKSLDPVHARRRKQRNRVWATRSTGEWRGGRRYLKVGSGPRWDEEPGSRCCSLCCPWPRVNCVPGPQRRTQPPVFLQQHLQKRTLMSLVLQAPGKAAQSWDVIHAVPCSRPRGHEAQLAGGGWDDDGGGPTHPEAQDAKNRPRPGAKLKQRRQRGHRVRRGASLGLGAGEMGRRRVPVSQPALAPLALIPHPGTCAHGRSREDSVYPRTHRHGSKGGLVSAQTETKASDNGAGSVTAWWSIPTTSDCLAGGPTWRACDSPAPLLPTPAAARQWSPDPVCRYEKPLRAETG